MYKVLYLSLLLRKLKDIHLIDAYFPSWKTDFLSIHLLYENKRFYLKFFNLKEGEGITSKILTKCFSKREKGTLSTDKEIFDILKDCVSSISEKSTIDKLQKIYYSLKDCIKNKDLLIGIDFYPSMKEKGICELYFYIQSYKDLKNAFCFVEKMRNVISGVKIRFGNKDYLTYGLAVEKEFLNDKDLLIKLKNYIEKREEEDYIVIFKIIGERTAIRNLYYLSFKEKFLEEVLNLKKVILKNYKKYKEKFSKKEHRWFKETMEVLDDLVNFLKSKRILLKSTGSEFIIEMVEINKWFMKCMIEINKEVYFWFHLKNDTKNIKIDYLREFKDLQEFVDYGYIY